MILKYVAAYSGLRPKADFSHHAVIFTHIPKTGGTSLDYILQGMATVHHLPARRVHGTIYGQFQGAGKGDTLEEFQTLPDEAVADLRCLTGHFPFNVHQRLRHPPLYVALVRDPLTRLLSQFRYGVALGGWPESASIEELIRKGALVDNVQTRQIAGLIDPGQPCNASVFDQALENLRSHYVLVGVSECFDEMVKLLITLQRWPDVAYGNRQVTEGAPSAELRQRAEEEVWRFFAYDAELHAHAVKIAEESWTNLFEGNPVVGQRQSQVLVAIPGLRINGEEFKLIPTAAFDHDLRPMLEARGRRISFV